ncbi:MAG: hypothetical protein ABI232_11075, partial [Jatrophihabitantaceae bacterium]
MISRVAFCPHPPLLVPEVSGSASAELDDLRAACRAAIVSLTGRQLVVVGSDSVSVVHSPLSRGTLAGFGAGSDRQLPTAAEAPALPLSLTVGA